MEEKRGPFGLPTDPPAAKTMLVGIVIGFVIYGASLLALWRAGDSPTGLWVSVALTFASMVFLVVWVFAIKKGFRLGSKRTRAERRRKERQPRLPPQLRR